MRYIIACLAVMGLLLLSCQDKNPDLVKTIDLKSFRLQTPENWQSIPGSGYDSQVGKLTNGKDALTYDYGWYSYDLRKEVAPDYIRSSLLVDGKPALLVRPQRASKGTIGLFVQVNSQTKLLISGTNIRDEQTVIKIFESIKF